MTIRDHDHEMTIEIPITFRIATREDVPKLEWHGQFAHFRSLIRRAYKEQLRGRRMMLVADFNGFPIGQVFIQLESNNSDIADGFSRAYLYSFRVMDLFQGRGIGTRLLYESEAMLVERGYRYATLSVAKENEGALRLYQRNGYLIVGQDPGRWNYVDQYGITRYVEEPCWVMEKSLS
jgi:ribosomal protein S18 acetylase RimI-like enzyme